MKQPRILIVVGRRFGLTAAASAAPKPEKPAQPGPAINQLRKGEVAHGTR